MGNSEYIELPSQYGGNNDEYIPLADVARKWGCSELKLLNWAEQDEFGLYCLQPFMPRTYAFTPWWYLIGQLVHYFLDGRTSITIPHGALCVRSYPFGITPTVRKPKKSGVSFSDPKDMFGDMSIVGLPPEVDVTVYRCDLHLHRYEIAMMEKKYPELSLEVLKAKTDSAPEPEETISITEPTKITEESAPNANDDDASPLLDKDDSDLLASSPPEVNVNATAEKQLPLPTEIDNKSNSIAQAEKPNSTWQPKKLKQKTELPLIGSGIESQSRNGDKVEPPEDGTVQEIRYLRLEEIIGNKKKGIPAMIPVSRSSWLAGVKSGLYPQPVKLGMRTVGWKYSDIKALEETFK